MAPEVRAPPVQWELARAAALGSASSSELRALAASAKEQKQEEGKANASSEVVTLTEQEPVAAASQTKQVSLETAKKYIAEKVEGETSDLDRIAEAQDPIQVKLELDQK